MQCLECTSHITQALLLLFTQQPSTLCHTIHDIDGIVIGMNIKYNMYVHCTVHQSFLLFLGPFDCTIPIPRIQMFLDVHTSTRIMKVLKNVPSLSGPQGGRCGRAEGHHKPLQSPGPQLARPAPIRRRWNKSRHCRSELRNLSLSPALAWPATNNQHDKRLLSDTSGIVDSLVEPYYVKLKALSRSIIAL